MSWFTATASKEEPSQEPEENNAYTTYLLEKKPLNQQLRENNERYLKQVQEFFQTAQEKIFEEIASDLLKKSCSAMFGQQNVYWLQRLINKCMESSPLKDDITSSTGKICLRAYYVRLAEDLKDKFREQQVHIESEHSSYENDIQFIVRWKP